jgi:hypothetical protein
MTTTTARARQPEYARAAGTARAGASGRLAPAGERRRPVLRVVEVRRDGSRRSAAGIAGWLLTGVLFASVFSVVICQALLVQAQSRLDAANREIAKEAALSKQQRSDIAKLESPHRIVDEAVDRLGMVAGPDVAYLQPDPADDQRAVLPPEAAAPTTAPPATTAPTTTAPMAVASASGRAPAVAGRSGAAATATTRATATTAAKAGSRATGNTTKGATTTRAGTGGTR